jgi:exodeoxyribonuclease VII small subunit
MAKLKKNLKFEEALERLEKISQTIEEGALPLEDSLKVFEEGMELVSYCEDLLTAAEGKVEILMQNKDGQKKEQEFDVDA